MDEIKTVSERRKAINDEIKKINIERDEERDVKLFFNEKLFFKFREGKNIESRMCSN